jgi:hypothetical protein
MNTRIFFLSLVFIISSVIIFRSGTLQSNAISYHLGLVYVRYVSSHRLLRRSVRFGHTGEDSVVQRTVAQPTIR